MRILLVDDPESSQYVKLYLRQQGYNVQSVSTVNEALSLLENEKYDILITEIYLPRISGLSLIKAAMGHNGLIPIVAMSGHANHAVARECLTSGATDFLFKPFRLKILDQILSGTAEKINRWRKDNII